MAEYRTKRSVSSSRWINAASALAEGMRIIASAARRRTKGSKSSNSFKAISCSAFPRIPVSHAAWPRTSSSGDSASLEMKSLDSVSNLGASRRIARSRDRLGSVLSSEATCSALVTLKRACPLIAIPIKRLHSEPCWGRRRSSTNKSLVGIDQLGTIGGTLGFSAGS